MKKTGRLTVHVHPAGFLMLAAALLLLPSREVLSVVLALLWHEGAHAVMMLLCRVPECHIELTPFGGMADARELELLSPVKQALIAASGVAASMAGAWISAAFLSGTEFGFLLFQNHFSLAFVNCLPAWPLDGARIVAAIAAAFGKERLIQKCLCIFSYVLGGVMILCGLYSAWNEQINLSLMTAGPYLWYAARVGNVSDRLRRIQLCHKKLKRRAALPVEIFVSARQELSSLLPGILGKSSSARYQLLIQTNEQGHIQHVWTEQEMLDAVLEGFDTAKK